MNNLYIDPDPEQTKRIHDRLKSIFIAIFLGAVLACLISIPFAYATTAVWAPTASERLIKLPGQHLEKAVESDFRKSELATALEETEANSQLKQSTLGDLQKAIEQADGETRVELQHQFLLEKKNYVEMLKENQDLRRKRARIKLRLYERLLGKLSRKKQAGSPQQKHLVSLQENAQARFQSSLSKVDMKLMQSVAMGTSRYSQEYARNMSAIESLVAAVNAHPSNQAPALNGIALSQSDYLRSLISRNEAELALVDQERIILAHMAKLISLDALALSEETQLASQDLDAPSDDVPRSYVVEYFINQ
ncbi:MAG: hypothetical protein JKX94_08615 [Sneathiella sp.]|nr:hypothetical protein [Sneathiella sp.]